VPIAQTRTHIGDSGPAIERQDFQAAHPVVPEGAQENQSSPGMLEHVRSRFRDRERDSTRVRRIEIQRFGELHGGTACRPDLGPIVHGE
jgi:hypothetical protein